MPNMQYKLIEIQPDGLILEKVIIKNLTLNSYEPKL